LGRSPGRRSIRAFEVAARLDLTDLQRSTRTIGYLSSQSIQALMDSVRGCLPVARY
jgi:hypothetical protein